MVLKLFDLAMGLTGTCTKPGMQDTLAAPRVESTKAPLGQLWAAVAKTLAPSCTPPVGTRGAALPVTHDAYKPQSQCGLQHQQS
jgi:hypothetical protein